MIFGYCRVSTQKQTDGNSLEAQEQLLRANGATEIFIDIYSGAKSDRPELNKLLPIIKKGDTFMATKLDRVARSVIGGVGMINGLADKGVTVHILNLGVMDNSPSGKLIRNVFLSFAEFERDMIIERTREGKRLARLKPDYRDGRPPLYDSKQISYALGLLNSMSYSQVTGVTGISKSTLIRAKRKRAAMGIKLHRLTAGK